MNNSTGFSFLFIFFNFSFLFLIKCINQCKHDHILAFCWTDAFRCVLTMSKRRDSSDLVSKCSCPSIWEELWSHFQTVWSPLFPQAHTTVRQRSERKPTGTKKKELNLRLHASVNVLKAKFHDFWNNFLWTDKSKVEMLGHTAQC